MAWYDMLWFDVKIYNIYVWYDDMFIVLCAMLCYVMFHCIVMLCYVMFCWKLDMLCCVVLSSVMLTEMLAKIDFAETVMTVCDYILPIQVETVTTVFDCIGFAWFPETVLNGFRRFQTICVFFWIFLRYSPKRSWRLLTLSNQTARNGCDGCGNTMSGLAFSTSS